MQSGNSNERKALLDMMETAVTYICDRGYFSFSLVNAIHKLGAFFIFRLKKNYKTTTIQALELTGTIPSGFLKVSDELVEFVSNSLKGEDAIFRIVRFQVLKIRFIICTNRRDLTTLEVITCYAYRWQIELFFKFLKRSINAIHLFSNTRNGSKVYLTLMLIFALLQLIMKQNCQKIVNNSEKQAGGFVASETLPIKDYHNPADWVTQLGLKFKKAHKISADWLTFLKNSISQIIDYQTINNFAAL
jgi:transposase